MEQKKIDLFTGLMDAEISRVRKNSVALYDKAMACLSINDYDCLMDNITSFVTASKSADYLEQLKNEVLVLVAPKPVEPVIEPAKVTMEDLINAVDSLTAEVTPSNNVE